MHHTALARPRVADLGARQSGSLGRSIAIGVLVFGLGLGFGLTTRDPSRGGVDFGAAARSFGARCGELVTAATASPKRGDSPEAFAQSAAAPAPAATPAPPRAAAARGASAEAQAATASSDEPATPKRKKRRARKDRAQDDATERPAAAPEAAEVAAPTPARAAPTRAASEATADPDPPKSRSGAYEPKSVLVPRAPRPSPAYSQQCAGAVPSPSAALASGDYRAAAAQLACAQLRAGAD